EEDVALGEEHPAAQRVRQRARLLPDLLVHEVLVAALLGHHRRPVDAAGGGGPPRAPPGGEGEPGGGGGGAGARPRGPPAPGVCSSRAGTSLATKFWPSERPTTIGELSLVATMRPGSSAQTTARP